jgi:hypothetical protein
VLRELAAAIGDSARAVDLWCDALVEARRVNEPAARSMAIAAAATLAAVPGRDIEAEQLAANVRAVTKAWTEAEIANQYELLRELLRSGRGRTRQMEELIAASVRALSTCGANDFITAAFALPLELSIRFGDGSGTGVPAPQAQRLLWGVRFPLSNLWTSDEVEVLVESGEAGKRVFALVLMESQPSLASVDRVIHLMSSSLSAFEQYHTLRVALVLAPDLRTDDCARLRAAIERERTRYIAPNTDRYRLTKKILEALRIKNVDGVV